MDLIFDEMAQEINCVQDHDYYTDKENCNVKKTAKIRKSRLPLGSVGEDGLLRDITRKVLKGDRRKGEHVRVNWYNGIGLKMNDTQFAIPTSPTLHSRQRVFTLMKLR